MMKFRNMKELGEYLQKMQKEGQVIESQLDTFRLLDNDRKLAEKFLGLIVKEIGD